ncbi:MAG: hypothetical protein NC121_11730 [Blautia sp.]|nr:hypothetical protein [Blautia sp.]
MKKIFSTKSRMIYFFWAFIGIILLILISQFKNTSLQGTIGNMVILYVFGSCIISGVIHRMVKKEKAIKRQMEQEKLPASDRI